MIECDIKKIMELLPHRYPLLLIDRVIEHSEGKIIAVKNVSMNEQFFQGHFPRNPVMPGVLIVEAMAQASILCHLLKQEFEGENVSNGIALFSSIEKAKFRKPVVPGDVVTITVTIGKQKKGFFKSECCATVNETKVCDATLMAYVKKEST